MDKLKHFQNSLWVGVPPSQYEGQKFSGRLQIQTAYFRKEFTLAESPGQLTMHISASSRYRLYINGTPVAYGPCRGDRFRHYYETIDVTKYLVAGKNLIAVKVVAYPPFESQHHTGDGQGPEFTVNSAAGPVLAVSGEVLGKNGQVLAALHTGSTQWQVCLDSSVEWETPKLTFWMGGMEIAHGGKLPVGWQSSFTPQGKWDLAEARWNTQPSRYGEVIYFPLTQRPIPLQYEKEIKFTREMPLKEDNGFSLEKPATIPPNTKAVIELDAGILTSAYISTKMQGGKGAKVTFKYAECYARTKEIIPIEKPPGASLAMASDSVIVMEKGKRDDSLGYDFLGHSDIYYPSGGQDEYLPFWFRVFRFVRIEVETADEALTIEKPTLVETAYPLEYTTTFRSSDKELEKVYEISRRTLQMCMHETYEDCPYYEQMQYTADTRLQMLFTYALCGDTRMAKRAMEDYHASRLPDGMLQSRYPVQAPQAIATFASHWIFMLEDYYQQTGDISIARKYRPTMDGVLDWYNSYVGESGLIENMPYWQFIDWIVEWDANAGVPNASFVGPSTVHNMVYAYAMDVAIRLNRLTGRVDTELEARSKQLKAKIEELCWDEKKGLYKEGPNFATEYTQNAQIFAVLTGLAEGDRAKSILTRALDDPELLVCSFPWMFYFIRALEKTGMYNRATKFVDVLREFVRLNTTTVPERAFEPRSECHAWGAFPLYEFPRMLLGVKQGSPGWDTITIQPYFIDIPGCGGTVYTPKGNVTIDWEKGENGIKVWGDLPAEATFIYPCGKEEKLPKGEFELLVK